MIQFQKNQKNYVNHGKCEKCANESEKQAKNNFSIYSAIPKDPVTGLREWRNNKMSACWRGFVMDETVKDQEPSAELTTPQFRD